MARRRKFHRTAPDRGWIVGRISLAQNFPSGDPDDNTQTYTLFDFADIDPEALTGRIEQDKSDWFVKRCILNIASAARLDGLTEGDCARMWSWGIGTMAIENAERVDTQDPSLPLIGSEVYNLWSRLFQTGCQPAYHVPVLQYAAADPSGTIGLGTVDVGPTAIDPAGYALMFGIWGPAFRTYDFTVSNAGLRNNQECTFAVSQNPSVVGHSWDNGDVLDVDVYYQVLVQKRRGS